MAPTKTDSISQAVSDPFSGIRIVNPTVSSNVLAQRMQGRKMVKMSLMKNYMSHRQIDGDWVTMGVLVNKLPTKTTKNGNPFSVWKLTDLVDSEKVVTVFLFKEAHQEHWKDTVGSVIGILNPSILPEDDKYGSIQLSVDHAGKIMIMGKSKDLGFCKGQRLDGQTCGKAINLNQCEYCIFHVGKAYKKFSAKRSELQASFNGRDVSKYSRSEPSLKSKVLKGQNVFYGGQSFVQEKGKRQPVPKKDKLTLMNLGLKRKAEAIESEENVKSIKKLTDMYGQSIEKVASSNSEFINSQLTIPSAGSRNLLRHLMKSNDKEYQKEKMPFKVISPKDLKEMRDKQCKLRQASLTDCKKDSKILENLTPSIGKGFKPGQNISFDLPTSKTIYNRKDMAKIKAIRTIQAKGPLSPVDPNSTKVSPKASSYTKSSSETTSTLAVAGKTESGTPESGVLQSRLGMIDSKKLEDIMKRKSSHAHQVEEADWEKQEFYFNVLEKKEQMEEKMASTTEIVCNVVSCLQCKYTEMSAADRCKKEHHSLKCHKAIKRFFACKDCKQRLHCFTKFPQRACRTCHGSNFEHTGMIAKRKGPVLPSEVLNIRGEERKFVNI